MRPSRARALSASIAAFAAVLLLVPLADAANCGRTTVGLTPLSELGEDRYHRAMGGLYPGGRNVPPKRHRDLGEDLARKVRPRADDGTRDPDGKIVLLTIGMSNTSAESQQLRTLAAADVLRHPSVTVVNGAVGGFDAVRASDPDSDYWAKVNGRLGAAGVTPEQVQVLWVKEAISRPEDGFRPEAHRLQDALRDILEIADDRFPKLRLAYLSSRIYAGYAEGRANPEPYAYESAFAVKWVIREQLRDELPVGPVPWLGWAAYLWADGLDARADGLTWECADFRDDGMHPSEQGAQKVAQMLLDFFHSDATAEIWYRYAGSPP